MKIEHIQVQSTRIPAVRPHQMAIGTTYHQDNVIVKLYNDDGVFGYGEAPHMVGHSQLGETPHTVRVILRHKLIPAILGKDPLNIEELIQLLDRSVPGNTRAKGALIMAAYDLAGKVLNTPVTTLLGGRVRDRIPLSWSLPLVDISTAVEEAHAMIKRGWRTLKIKAGRPNPNDDIEVIRALRDELGSDIRLRVDANQAYNVKSALHVIRNVASCGLDFFEQPVHRNDLIGMREVTQQSPIPIMADESIKSPAELAAVAQARAADYVSIYIIGPGGPLNSRKMAIIAESYGMRGYIGGALESAIGAAAGLHVAAASPNIDLGCELYGQYMLEQDVVRTPFLMEDGALVVPQSPGLGIDVDESRFTDYREGEIEEFRYAG